ncbi:hypothetical protein HPULCUR_008145 [Helicostylum pulchrum]|uniref:Uncharacterized protein n=1 Tax=Helicostylum pulchrum TaxID=562976 RepID=A0ABP9Y6T2_9FUNG
MPTVYIIIYSLYHHIYTVALEVKKVLKLKVEPTKATEPLNEVDHTEEPKPTPRSTQPKLEEKKGSKCFCM